MADYSQTPPRPNINPTPMSDVPPRQLEPAPTGWGMIPALGAVAVVGIVALVAWSVMGTDTNKDNVVTSPDAAPAASQPAADPVPAAPTVTPDTPAAPEPTVQPDTVQPEPVPQEIPAPAPEAAPVPTTAPAPAPTN